MVACTGFAFPWLAKEACLLGDCGMTSFSSQRAGNSRCHSPGSPSPGTRPGVKCHAQPWTRPLRPEQTPSVGAPQTRSTFLGGW